MCPGRNAVAVAELTMGLILALDRRIADNVADARQGRWAKATYSKANGLLGSTLGILGMGSIGLAVAERAAGFGMRIGCLDRAGRSRATCDRLAELDVVGHRSLPELLAVLRRGEPAPTVVGGDQEPRGRRLPGRDAARLDPREHLAR